MNKAQKNIVIVGFIGEEKNSLSLPYIDKGRVHYVDSIGDAIKYQGYLLIINNKDNIHLVELDKKYHKSFQKFAKVWIYNENYKWQKDHWSGIEKVNRDIFMDISLSLSEEWEEYKTQIENGSKPLKFHLAKKKKLDDLYLYLKNFKAISTQQIVKDLKINARTVERYMSDLNTIYHNIGYDYNQNEWYLIW